MCIRDRFKNFEIRKLDSYCRVKSKLSDKFPDRLAEILSLEFGLFYFPFKLGTKVNYTDNKYGYTKSKGVVEMVFGFIFIILIETVVVHILLHKWSPLFAFLCSFSSLYLILLFVAILRSRTFFPVEINSEQQKLILQYGYINKSVIDFSDLNSVQLTSKSKQIDLIKLSTFEAVESYNLIIHCNKVQSIRMTFGIRKKYTSIALYLDRPNDFINNLTEVIDQNEKVA